MDIADEHYIEGKGGECWQLRSSIDRRFWHTSGGWPAAIGYGVVDDYGDICRTEARPQWQ